MLPLGCGMLDSPSQDSWPTPEAPTPGSYRASVTPRKERLLAALQAASLSSMLSMFWCGIASRSSAHSFWTFPNLMAGLFYGQFSLRPDFGFHTLAGLSIH